MRKLGANYHRTTAGGLEYVLRKATGTTRLRAGMVIYYGYGAKYFYSQLYELNNKLVDQYLRPIERLTYISYMPAYSRAERDQMDLEFLARTRLRKLKLLVK